MESAGFSRRCMGMSVLLPVVPSSTGLPSKIFRPILPALSAPPSPFSCSQALHPDSSFLWAPCLPAASPHCYPITTYLDSPPWSPAPILTDQVVKEPVTPAGFTPLCSQPLPPVALTLLGVKLAFLSGITGPHLVPSPCRHLPLHSLLLLLLLGRFSRVRSSHGIFQARVLEWVAIAFSRPRRDDIIWPRAQN